MTQRRHDERSRMDGTRKGTGASASARRRAELQRALWRRRIITGVGLVLVLALLVAGIVVGVRAALVAAGVIGAEEAQSGETAQSTSSVTADGVVASDGTVDIPRCVAGDLDVSVDPSTGTMGEGQAITLHVTNTSDVSCVTALGAFTWRLTSGSDTVVDTATCADRDQSATPLLLSPGTEWTGSVQWNGERGCAAPGSDGDGEAQVAEAGTYTVEFFLDGTKTDGKARLTRS